MDKVIDYDLYTFDNCRRVCSVYANLKKLPDVDLTVTLISELTEVAYKIKLSETDVRIMLALGSGDFDYQDPFVTEFFEYYQGQRAPIGEFAAFVENWKNDCDAFMLAAMCLNDDDFIANVRAEIEQLPIATDLASPNTVIPGSYLDRYIDCFCTVFFDNTGSLIIPSENPLGSWQLHLKDCGEQGTAVGVLTERGIIWMNYDYGG